MIKVVEAISDTNIGGAGVLLENRLRHTDKRIFDTAIVLPQSSMLKGRFLDAGVKIITTKSCNDRSFDLKGVYEYVKIFRELRPDILNAHGCMSARIAAKLCGVPIKLYTRHCVYPVGKLYSLKAVRGLFSILSDFLSDGVIAVADSAKTNLKSMGVNEEKIHVIINGAEGLTRLSDDEKKKLRSKCGISENDFVVTICARLEACKDHDCFLRAAALICSNSENFKFLIIGSGSREEALKTLCNRLKIEEKVIFTGFKKDVAPYMNISDLNVNCSIGTETSSLALSEGMSIGKPSVVSNYGGNTYMVRDFENGFVYKAGDYVDLAKKIKMVADMKRNNSLSYSSLCKASENRYKGELNALAMTKKTQRLYIDMLKNKRPKR